MALVRFDSITLVCMALVLPVAKSTVPGVVSAVYGDIVGHSDFEMNMQPPEESTKDIEESLDALMKAENIKNEASQADFTYDKTKMVEAEKEAIHEIVSSAFQPLLAYKRG